MPVFHPEKYNPEIVLTIVRVDVHNNVAYPMTEVRRIEFDTPEALELWLRTCASGEGVIAGVTNVEELIADEKVSLEGDQR
jgi:hypothetical protein